MSRKLFIILFSLFFVFAFSSNTLNQGDNKEKLLIAKTIEILELAHLSPVAIDDTFSKQVYDLYIKSLDFNKLYFTQENKALLRNYETKIDDEIREQSLDFFNLSYELISSQTEYVKSLYEEMLAAPFDYSKDEQIAINPRHRDYVANNKELKDFWRKYLKYQVIEEILTAENNQKKALETNDTHTIKSFEEFEQEARERIRKRYETRFNRLEKISKEDRFAHYLNAITSAYDPHTNYFPPKAKEDFDIRISGQLEGIGATLSERDGYIRVVSIVPGSPSWKQGDLKPDDMILKVAQEHEEPVDIADMRLDEAVRLIRGPKGTKVTLTVRKVDGSLLDITITRDVVQLEEQYARSAILTVPEHENIQIGYIYLPQFYVDMSNKKGRNSADDMKIEIEKLKQQNVSGIIVDLRDNGGGSLPGVVDIAGLFVPRGPIVQVMVGNEKQVLRNTSSRVTYEGPLVIMVNTFSASASEILAAAMQDYRRAVIVGTQSTYGKGTVQRFVDIDRFVEAQYNDLKPLGSLKLTIQKFYRINGGSTQLLGVTPDIILPDIYQHIDIGEKDLDFPMEWTEIDKESYQLWSNRPDIRRLSRNSARRVETDSAFMLINEAATWFAERRNESSRNLQIEQYRKEKESENSLSERYSKAGTQVTPLQIQNSIAYISTNDAELDSVNINRIKEWHSELQEDITLFETCNIMFDLISSSRRR